MGSAETKTKNNGGIIMPGIGHGIGIPFAHKGFQWSTYWETRTPTNIGVHITGASTARVTWSDAVNSADGIKVYVSDDEGATKVLKNTVAFGIGFTDVIGLMSSTFYTFYVVAYKGIIESTPLITTENTLFLFDKYAIDEDNPLISPRSSDPGPGIFNVTDAGNNISIQFKKLIFNGGTQTWGTTQLASSIGYDKKDGLCFGISINPSRNSNTVFILGNTALDNNPNTAKCGIYFNSAFGISLLPSRLFGFGYSNNIKYRCVVVFNITGVKLFVRGGNCVDWTLIAIDYTNNQDKIYPIISTYDSSIQVKASNLFGKILGYPFNSFYGLTTYRKSGILSYDQPFIHNADFLLYLVINNLPPVTLSIIFRKQDDNNYLKIDINNDGSINIIKVVAATPTIVNSAAAGSIVNGNTICIRCIYQTIDICANNIRKGLASISNFINSEDGNIIIGGAIVSNLDIWNSTLAGDNLKILDDLDYLPDIPPYASNAVSYQIMPTYDGSGQVVHQSILYKNEGWNGHKLWEVCTPYPNLDSSKENPSIFVSDDGGDNWTIPEGLTNPIRNKPIGASDFNADPEIFWSSDGITMWMIYRVRISNIDYLRITNSVDGIIWEPDQDLFNVPKNYCNSPAVLWDGTQYVMWSVNSSSHVVNRRTCATPNGVWSAPILCTIDNVLCSQPGTFTFPWHITVVKDDDKYIGLLALSPTNGMPGELYYIESLDGINWNISDKAVIPRGVSGSFDAFATYRAGMVKTGINTYDVWYSGIKDDIYYEARQAKTTLYLR